MKVIFYLFTIIAIMYELHVLFNPKKTLNFMKEFRRISEIESDDGIKKYNSKQITFYVFSLGYLIWGTIGLMTFNWVIFLIMLLIGIIPKRHYLQYIIDSLIVIPLLIFAIVNTFQLKINLFNYISDML